MDPAHILGELIFELLLLHGCCLADLSELLLQLSNSQTCRHCIIQQVDPTISTLS
jgi:hypothetical protein